MLAGLEAVEWTSLTHCHGVATDVPDQLRAVAEGEQVEADQALYEMYGNLWNDGTVYSASAAAAPFLVELAAAAEVDAGRRLDVLVLLGRLGAAAHGDPSDLQNLGRALETGRDALAPLLDAEDAALRVAAAGLAGMFTAPPRTWAARLRELRDAETDTVIRSHFGVAAALAEGRQPDRAEIDRAAAADPYIAAWRGNRFEGLVGLRLSRNAARQLALLLTELSLER